LFVSCPVSPYAGRAGSVKQTSAPARARKRGFEPRFYDVKLKD
jgi:hypothetical protein